METRLQQMENGARINTEQSRNCENDNSVTISVLLSNTTNTNSTQQFQKMEKKALKLYLELLKEKEKTQAVFETAYYILQTNTVCSMYCILLFIVYAV